MKKLLAVLAPAALLLASRSVAAAPTMGTWLDARLSSETQGPDLRHVWSPLKGLGWTSLPARVIGVNVGGVAHPLCVTASSSGWVGFGRPRATANKVVLACETFAADSTIGYFFEIAASKPSPLWIGTTASTPEPRGAIGLLTQEGSRRKIFACRFDKGGDVFVGHIGDDGVCQGSTRTGGRDSSSSYLTLVMKGTGSDATPRWGWVDAGPTYVPHVPTVATETRVVGTAGAALTRTVCAATDGGFTWPGWVLNGQCDYFTYFNGRTEKKTTAVYKVNRVQPGAPKVPWVFNRMGGKAYYACSSSLTSSGRIRGVMFGFTNNPQTCTDGKDSTDAPPRLHGWTNTRIVELPDADAGAG